MTIRLLDGELIHADRQTKGRTDRQNDMTKLTVIFEILPKSKNDDRRSVIDGEL